MFSVISILDIFGFEDFAENSFEQLCINFANETLQHYLNKHIFKLEQVEYAKEKLEWTPIQYNDNQPIMHMISKKPIGVFHLLDDESNFPKVRFSIYFNNPLYRQTSKLNLNVSSQYCLQYKLNHLFLDYIKFRMEVYIISHVLSLGFGSLFSGKMSLQPCTQRTLFSAKNVFYGFWHQTLCRSSLVQCRRFP